MKKVFLIIILLGMESHAQHKAGRKKDFSKDLEMNRPQINDQFEKLDLTFFENDIKELNSKNIVDINNLKQNTIYMSDKKGSALFFGD